MAISRYQKKFSGLLLDRNDIHLEVPRVDYEKLDDKRIVEEFKTIRARVQAPVQQLHLSTRAYYRVFKIVRTIADLAGSEMIATNHVADEAQ
jgi:magnesium chelatase family protein